MLKKTMHGQAKTYETCMHATSDEEVEWSSSDNDEDYNKSSSAYSSEG
jgi:hypothetical protein